MSAEAKLLVVDDEFNILELLATSLRFAGFEVVTAGNGREAIEKAENEQPDLIVLDVMMPGMDGFEVTRRLRDAGRTYPVLFLTAKDATEDKVAGLGAGGDDYVTKPFSLDEVIARIRAILRRSRNAQEEDDAILRVDDLSLRRGNRPLPHRVQPAALPDAQRKPRAFEGTDSRPRMGVRLQRRFLHCGVVHFVPAPQD